MECLGDDDVAAFVTRAVDDTRRAAIEAHLDTCAACFELVGEFGRVFESVSAVAEVSVAGQSSLPEADPQPVLSVLLQSALLGHRIGPYLVQSLLGWGGAGVVYAGHDTRLDRPVALKIVAAVRVPVATLKEEARAVASLRHPNVVEVYDVLEEGGRLVIVMELVDGGTLRAWQQSAGIEATVAMYRAAGRGLVAAHDAGLVHRDFKPENVLVGKDGRPRVTDFGTRAVAGTPFYMSPEQRRGDPVDARTDQFAFCKALAAALGERAPARLETVLRRGLEAEAARRFASMRGLLDALRPRRPRWPWAVAAAGVVTAVVGAALLVGAPRGRDGCVDAAAEGQVVWTQARRDALRERFVREDPDNGGATWERVEPAMAQWFRSWADERIAACHLAQGGADEATVRARRTCLQDGLAEAEAWLDGLGSADADGVTRAVAGTAALPAPERCQDADPAHPAPLPDALLRARVARRQGEAQHALEIATALLDAGGIDDDQVLAALRYEIAINTAQLGRASEATAAYTEAYWSAASAGDPKLMVEAAGGLAHHLAARESSGQEAQTWLQHARAAAARAPDDLLLEANVVATEASVAMGRGDHKAAAVALRQAIGLRSKGGGAPPDTAGLRANLATALKRAGELEEGLKEAVIAADELETLLGPNHPSVATARNTVGTTLAELQRDDEALVQYRYALQIRERRLGPDHPDVASILSNIAQVHEHLGDLEAAVAGYERALAIMRKQEGGNPANLAIMLSNLAGVHVRRKEYAQALPLADEAFETLSAVVGLEHPVTATIGANTASLHSRLGDYAWADAQCPRSIAALEAKFGVEHQRLVGPLTNCAEHDLRVKARGRARERLARARAIVAAAPDRFDATTRGTVAFASARALDAPALAQEALAVFEADPAVYAAEIEEIEAWLKK